MKKISIVVLMSLATVCYSQNEKTRDSVKIVTLTSKQMNTLIELENQIELIKQKQRDLISFIIDAKGFDIDKVKEFHVNNDKLYFTTK